MADTPEGFIDIMNEVKLPPEDVDYALNNPERLTKEGCEQTLKSWKNGSRNKYVTKKYELMLARCKNFASSGKTVDGKTVLSRNEDNKPLWVEKID